jgi:hypothetical protein
MHLTPEQQADEQALRDKETGAELEVVNKVRAPRLCGSGFCAAADVVNPCRAPAGCFRNPQQRFALAVVPERALRRQTATEPGCIVMCQLSDMARFR